jgi:hypothetical protein
MRKVSRNKVLRAGSQTEGAGCAGEAKSSQGAYRPAAAGPAKRTTTVSRMAAFIHALCTIRRPPLASAMARGIDPERGGQLAPPIRESLNFLGRGRRAGDRAAPRCGHAKAEHQGPRSGCRAVSGRQEPARLRQGIGPASVASVAALAEPSPCLSRNTGRGGKCSDARECGSWAFDAPQSGFGMPPRRRRARSDQHRLRNR